MSTGSAGITERPHWHGRRERGLPISSPLPQAVTVSFEFFPPKTEKMEQSLWTCVERLSTLNPSYVSVTYGAGGSTRERTHATVIRLQREAGLPTAAHLTCVGASRGEIDEVARRYWDAGVRHVVALRGDPPEGTAGYEPHPDGYAYAADLVAGLKRIGDFEISVAAYPEVHPEAASAAADLDNLHRKVDAGAGRAITQFFFDVNDFFRFRDKVVAAGIDVILEPGILPVSNFERVVQFARTCHAKVPSWMHDLFEGLDDDPDTRRLIAASVAAEQCRALSDGGVDHFHFYTLNRADLVYAICHLLGVRPGSQADRPAAAAVGAQ